MSEGVKQVCCPHCDGAKMIYSKKYGWTKCGECGGWGTVDEEEEDDD